VKHSGFLIACGAAGLLCWVLAGSVSTRRPVPAPAPPDFVSAEQWRLEQANRRPHKPLLPVSRIRGREGAASTPEEGYRQRVAALREVYHEDDSASNYYLAAQLVKLREAEQMDRTAGLSSWRDPTPEEGAELVTLLARAKAKAQDAATKRSMELLARRAFVPRE
jgi:hypothetical protein